MPDPRDEHINATQEARDKEDARLVAEREELKAEHARLVRKQAALDSEIAAYDAKANEHLAACAMRDSEDAAIEEAIEAGPVRFWCQWKRCPDSPVRLDEALGRHWHWWRCSRCHRRAWSIGDPGPAACPLRD